MAFCQPYPFSAASQAAPAAAVALKESSNSVTKSDVLSSPMERRSKRSDVGGAAANHGAAVAFG
jgi:hypothetical protein